VDLFNWMVEIYMISQYEGNIPCLKESFQYSDIIIMNNWKGLILSFKFYCQRTFLEIQKNILFRDVKDKYWYNREIDINIFVYDCNIFLPQNRMNYDVQLHSIKDTILYCM
jgi:hypothetical protein